MIVYLACNKVNGKIYVGQTVVPLRKRKAQHLSASKAHRSNSAFHNAIRKYGEENFEWEEMVTCHSKEDLDSAEKSIIAEMRERYPGQVYNVTEGGGGIVGYKFSDESRRKLSERYKGKPKPWMQGKKKSAEHCRKMSEARRGVKQSPELIQKRAAGLKGHVVSTETRKKISAAHRGRKIDNYAFTEARRKHLQEALRKRWDLYREKQAA